MKYVILIALLGYCLAVRQQSVAITGKLLCGTRPAAGVTGSERELTTIDPVFKVYHDCDDGIKPGKRKVKFRIPSSYITNGPVAKRTFDIGVLNLETIFPEEERELI
ncbi:Transthyretin-like family protein [Teladorsagia circumcincta]|uniref:Transthyretin-like family protein n=1 Tax=Teladorsagia circumcincta TaxID=45464 RepID=A0A2G9URM5_TELCI|nr:Transthyretin-like family protein [Teladorsagia circumcincta]